MYQNFFLIMAMVVVGMAWYANSSKRNKINCYFTRVNKTSIHRFVRMTERYVIFDHKKYDIVSSCVVFEWWDKGLVHMLFPQWVATAHYTYASRWPFDPSTGKIAIISPEVRQAMNKEEWVKSYAREFAPPATRKQSFLQQYFPLMIIVLVVLMGFYFYTNMQSLAHAVSEIANKVNALAR